MAIKKVIIEEVKYVGNFTEEEYDLIKKTLAERVVVNYISTERQNGYNNEKILLRAKDAYRAFTGDDAQKEIDDFLQRRELRRMRRENPFD